LSEPVSRRDFLAGGALAAAATVVAATSLSAQTAADNASTAPAAATAGSAQNPRGGAFKLLYAPHFGLFEKNAGKDLGDQLQFMADHGFRSLEDNNLPKRPVEEQERIGKELERLNFQMGVFVAHGSFGDLTFVKRDPAIRDALVKEMQASVEIAKRVNAKWATVVLDAHDPKVDPGIQTANAIDNLRACAEVFEKAGLIMVLEPLNPWNHPGLFLTGVPQAYAICRGVNSPACKILDDFYHQQISNGNLIPNMEACWDEIAYYQVGDNPGRKEPGTGEINYRNVFKYLYDRGFKGVVGMEHGKAENTKEGELAVIKAYQEADNFPV
jgi:hydroxypyruvate isomerase